jgi:hypothetical protein
VTVRAFSPGQPANHAEAMVVLLGGSLPSAPVSFARDPAPTSASPLAAAGVAFARQPVVTAVLDLATSQPASVPQGTTNQNVRLLGAGFTGANALVFNLGAYPDGNFTLNSLTVDSATQITANLSIYLPAALGLRVARVTAGGVTSTAASTGGNLLTVLAAPTFLPLYRGGICVADGSGACIGGDARPESGLGPLIGYMRSAAVSGTVPVYRAACHSNSAGTCTGWSLSLAASGDPVGYLSTTAPPSGNAPLWQSGGLLLQGLGGTPSAYLWTNPP